MGTDPNPDDGRPPTLSRADMSLLRRAARGRWAVPDAVRTEVVVQLMAMVADPNSPRQQLRAVQTLVALDRADMAADRLELDRERLAFVRESAGGDASGMAEVHQRMREYRDPDESPGDGGPTGAGAGVVPPPAEPV